MQGLITAEQLAIVRAGWAGESLDSYDAHILGLPKAEWNDWITEAKQNVLESKKEHYFVPRLNGIQCWKRLGWIRMMLRQFWLLQVWTS